MSLLVSSALSCVGVSKGWLVGEVAGRVQREKSEDLSFVLFTYFVLAFSIPSGTGDRIWSRIINHLSIFHFS